MGEGKIVSDTTMMFLACACMALHERNGFGKNRLMQFIADIKQIDNDNEYSEIRAYLEEVLAMNFPEIGGDHE